MRFRAWTCGQLAVMGLLACSLGGLGGCGRRVSRSDDAGGATPMGATCDDGRACAPGASCRQTRVGRICTTRCAPDLPSTPAVDEDSCPARFRCADLDPTAVDGHGLCAAICTPQLGKTSCPAGLACAIGATGITSPHDVALCIDPRCTRDEHCPVRFSTRCSAADPSACQALHPDGYCAPDDRRRPDGAASCARPGRCDRESGLCRAHTLGDANAQVGDPCRDDFDCGAAMSCWMPDFYFPRLNVPFPRNGYCVIDGCTFANTLVERACPAGSVCGPGPGGRCYRGCSLSDPSSCRGLPEDRFGDYECYTDQGVSEPYCAPASYSCESGCESVAPPSNPQHMRCRDPLTGAELPPTAPEGICLDDTASGPVAP